MSGISNSFQKVVTTAKNNPQLRKSVNLAEVSAKMAEKVGVSKPNINKEQFLQGVNKVATEAKEVVLPSAETLRAYHGIDTPIVSGMTSKLK